MDYLPAFPPQVGIKGCLWQTNVFQDGSHETYLVFKVVGFKGMFELWRFSHLLSPLLIRGRVEALPTPTPSSWSSSSRRDGQPLPDSRSVFPTDKQEVPGMGGCPFLWTKYHFIFSWVCGGMIMRLKSISDGILWWTYWEFPSGFLLGKLLGSEWLFSVKALRSLGLCTTSNRFMIKQEFLCCLSWCGDVNFRVSILLCCQWDNSHSQGLLSLPGIFLIRMLGSWRQK